MAAPREVFGAQPLALPDEETAEVALRAPAAGSAWCSCLDFALSEDAQCPHVQAAQQRVLGDAAQRARFEQGTDEPASRVLLRHAAQRALLWLPGAQCPPALAEMAERQLAPSTAPEPLEAAHAALLRVLRAAREGGHEVLVDEAVWRWLAGPRDARERLMRLEALYPEGPASRDLAALWPAALPPLLPLQWEAALFAVCAGRAVLADEAALGAPLEALAALLLWRARFGVARVLVIAPADALAGWCHVLPPDVQATALDCVAGDEALHRAFAPELVVLHEPPAGGVWVDAERAAALLRLAAPHAIVIPSHDAFDDTSDIARAEWALRMAFVDAERRGAYAALLAGHGERDEDGALQGIERLAALPQTLSTSLLRRTVADVRTQLPERVESVVPVAVAEGSLYRHRSEAAQRSTELARARAVGWLPASAQRHWHAIVQGLRRTCAGAGTPGGGDAGAGVGAGAGAGDGAGDGDGARSDARAFADAKARVLAQRLEHAAPGERFVAFTQWPDAAAAVADALRAHGVQAPLWRAADDSATRDAALADWRADDGATAARVLVVADPGSAALALQGSGAQVVHLDRPWDARARQRRFGRVHARGQACMVPVAQLVAAGSFEAALDAVLSEEGSAPQPDWLDAQPSQAFLDAASADAWLATLERVFARMAL